MKSVCIVGAGPAGLVAAKTLLQCTPRIAGTEGSRLFDVTILEKKYAVGGMWAHEPNQDIRDEDTKCASSMPTNLSRFTVAFSDLSWETLSKDVTGHENATAEDLPMFPQAWQVGRYLQAYAAKYIPQGTIKFGCKVIEATKIAPCEGVHQWKVSWETTTHDACGESVSPHPVFHEHVFDHIIIGSGFFQRPRTLDALSIDPSHFSGRVIHSSQSHSITDLIPNTHTSGGNIVVIGGSISGPEAAASLAAEVSRASYGPSAARSYAGYKIYHVTTKPFYAVPRYLPTDPSSSDTSDSYNPRPHFVPLDLAMYDLGRRPPGPISASTGPVPPERAAMTHAWLKGILGGDQSDLGCRELVHTKDDTPPRVAITDHYADFVREGAIQPVRGRVIGLTASPSSTSSQTHGPSGTCTVHLDAQRQSNPTETSPVSTPGTATNPNTIEDVVGIIYATGYEPFAAVDFLDTDTLSALGYDATCRTLPLLLPEEGHVSHPARPTLAFVGMYVGPYWGILEMQARAIAARWSHPTTPSSASPETTQTLLSLTHLRTLLSTNSPSLPQFWMGDYTGHMESLSRTLHIPRTGPQSQPCIPARYTSSSSSSATRTLQSLTRTLQASQSATYVAAATFRALLGTWTLHTPTIATATFHLRAPTAPGFDAEYLLLESGDVGVRSRRHVYRYTAAADCISIWAVKDEGYGDVDACIGELHFEKESVHGRWWVARVVGVGERVYEFRFCGVRLERWRVGEDGEMGEMWFGRIGRG